MLDRVPPQQKRKRVHRDDNRDRRIINRRVSSNDRAIRCETSSDDDALRRVPRTKEGVLKAHRDQDYLYCAGPVTYQSFEKLYGQYLKRVALPIPQDANVRTPGVENPQKSFDDFDDDEELTMDDLSVGDCVEVRNDDDDELHIARIIEQSDKGFRIVWFYFAWQTFLKDAGNLMHEQELFTSNHCECHRRYYEPSDFVRRVSVFFGPKANPDYDFFCRFHFDEHGLVFDEAVREIPNPTILRGELYYPVCGHSWPLDDSDNEANLNDDEEDHEIKEDVSEKIRMMNKLYILRATLRKGLFFGIRRKHGIDRHLEEIVQVIDFDFSDDSRPWVEVEEYAHCVKVPETKNSLEYTGKIRVLRNWDTIELLTNEVFVEIFDDTSARAELPIHLAHNGAGRLFFIRKSSFESGKIPEHLMKLQGSLPKIAEPLRTLSLMCSLGNDAFGYMDSEAMAVHLAVDIDKSSIDSYNARAAHLGYPQNGFVEEVSGYLERCYRGEASPANAFSALIGCHSCASYSRANAKPEEKERASVALICSAVEYFRPKVVSPNLNFVTANEARTAAIDATPAYYLYSFFLKLGYKVWRENLVAAYYGNPQARIRHFTVATAPGVPLVPKPIPSHWATDLPTQGYYGYLCTNIGRGPSGEVQSVKLDGYEVVDHAPCETFTVRDCIGFLCPPKAPHARLMGDPTYRYHFRSPDDSRVIDHTDSDNTLNPDGLFRTITSEIRTNSKGFKGIHYIQRRWITIHEAALAQGLRNDEIHLLCGTDKSLLKQIANAVPTQMAFAIGCEVRRIMARDSSWWKQNRPCNVELPAILEWNDEE